MGSAAAALAACSSNQSTQPDQTTLNSAVASTPTTGPGKSITTRPGTVRNKRHAPRLPGERWDPSRPEGTDLLPQIEHVVVVMMENHSFDNYFGMLGRGDGFTLDASGKPTNSNPDKAGKPLRAFHLDNTCQLPSVPSQAWNASHTQWNNGAMDGFVRSDSGAVSMGYWNGNDLEFYYSLAKTFPLCDRWFGSCMAQTYPNRRFLLAGTARGNIDTAIGTLADPPPPNGTIMELLGRNGISWADYYTDLPSLGLYIPVAQANAEKLKKMAQFYADAEAGKLPAFSLIEPNFDHGSEENSEDITRGEAFVAKVVDAVMTSPNWSKTMLVWCYDEHGGYYDHVPPPLAPKPDGMEPRLGPNDMPGSYDRLGFRVPAVVISPFAKRDYVSNVVRDHTAILGLLEHKFNLPALTHRDGWADDLTDCLDFNNAPAFLKPPKLSASKNHNPFGTDGTPAPICTTGPSVP